MNVFYFKKKGFFVEAGALDGETMSNTLTIERNQSWTGLLIEADPVSFEKMKEKNRKAWLANVCLSMYPYPKKVRMIFYFNVIIGNVYFYRKHSN